MHPQPSTGWRVDTLAAPRRTQVDDVALRRLDKSLLELSLVYYKDESRRNKKAKQLTGRSAPQLLARHHFKRAYYSEFRRDAASAFKHWRSWHRLRDRPSRACAPLDSRNQADLHIAV